jgi:hypothetical protein
MEMLRLRSAGRTTGISKPIPEAIRARAEIVSRYKKAVYCYLAPVIFLLLGFVWPTAFGLFLFGLLPCSIAGMVFTKHGLALAKRSGDIEKKTLATRT